MECHNTASEHPTSTGSVVRLVAPTRTIPGTLRRGDNEQLEAHGPLVGAFGVRREGCNAKELREDNGKTF